MIIKLNTVRTVKNTRANPLYMVFASGKNDANLQKIKKNVFITHG